MRKWVERTAQLLIKEGHTSIGPVMCEPDGETMLSSQDVDIEFMEQLRRVQESRTDLLEETVDVFKEFGIFRSMRRASESRATEQDVEDRVIDLINRWRKMDANRKGAMAMRDYYLDMVLIKRRESSLIQWRYDSTTSRLSWAFI